MAEQVFYEIARWRLDEQLDQIRELNSRLMVTLTGATALVVLFAAFQDLQAVTSSDVAVGFASAAVGVYVALLITAVLGYRDPRLNLGPDLAALGTRAGSDEAARANAARVFSQAVSENESKLARKSQFVYATILLWAFDVLLLLAAALTTGE